MAKASVQRKAPTARKGRKSPRPQLDLFDDDAGGGKVVKMPAPAPAVPAPMSVVAVPVALETAPPAERTRGLEAACVSARCGPVARRRSCAATTG